MDECPLDSDEFSALSGALPPQSTVPLSASQIICLLCPLCGPGLVSVLQQAPASAVFTHPSALHIATQVSWKS
jgi:hypothetical protein